MAGVDIFLPSVYVEKKRQGKLSGYFEFESLNTQGTASGLRMRTQKGSQRTKMFAGPSDATNLPLSKETAKPGRPKVDNQEENKEDGILTGSTLSKIVQELESYARSSDFESDHDETKSNASYSIASHFSDGTNVSYPYSESSSPLLIKGKISELINPQSNVPPTNTVAVKLPPVNTSQNDHVVVTENETPKTFDSVAARLFRARESFVANSDPHPNRKEEMTLLMKEYKRLSMNLKALVASVREYQLSNQWLQQARYVVSTSVVKSIPNLDSQC